MSGIVRETGQRNLLYYNNTIVFSNSSICAGIGYSTLTQKIPLEILKTVTTIWQTRVC